MIFSKIHNKTRRKYINHNVFWLRSLLNSTDCTYCSKLSDATKDEMAIKSPENTYHVRETRKLRILLHFSAMGITMSNPDICLNSWCFVAKLH